MAVKNNGGRVLNAAGIVYEFGSKRMTARSYD